MIDTSAAAPTMRGAGAATRLIIAASVGNALEFYEILVYGYFAVIIAKVFFPAVDPAISLLVTFGTFGISFLARPVGAIFLGAYGDRKGRKSALTLSILLMTTGTGLMTIMPDYGSVGLAAPVLVIAARLLQRAFRSAANSRARPPSLSSIVPTAPAISPAGNGRARVLPRSSPPASVRC